MVTPGKVTVFPPVGQWPVAAPTEHLIAVDPLDAVGVPYDPRAARTQIRRKPGLPDVRWFDDVVVDGDDAGYIAHVSNLLGRTEPCERCA